MIRFALVLALTLMASARIGSTRSSAECPTTVRADELALSSRG
jgi:hypothetical protein